MLASCHCRLYGFFFVMFFNNWLPQKVAGSFWLLRCLFRHLGRTQIQMQIQIQKKTRNNTRANSGFGLTLIAEAILCNAPCSYWISVVDKYGILCWVSLSLPPSHSLASQVQINGHDHKLTQARLRGLVTPPSSSVLIPVSLSMQFTEFSFWMRWESENHTPASQPCIPLSLASTKRFFIETAGYWYMFGGR